METDFTEFRVAIFGLGLMGGSLAMALKGKCQSIYGIDPNSETISLALSRKVVDEASCSADKRIADADLIILAAPVMTNLSLINDIQGTHPREAIVIDLGSTKTAITLAMDLLPAQFDPIGGHPMCGKEHGGLIHADPFLFLNAPFALTPLVRSSAFARSTAEKLVRSIGSLPIWLDAETHDRWVACTSHLPFLIANALAASTPEEAFPMVGPGFRSTTRLAPSPWSVMGDILITNRENILDAMQEFRRHFEILETLLEEGDFEKLQYYIEIGRRKHEKLLP